MTTNRQGIGEKEPPLPTIDPVTGGLGRSDKQPQVEASSSFPAGLWPTGTSGGGIPIPMGTFIPPNGFAGMAQQTPAVQAIYRGRRSGGSSKRRKRTGKKKAAGARKSTRRAGARKSSVAKRLVKGSAAAKRYMAKIRRMRKR